MAQKHDETAVTAESANALRDRLREMIAHAVRARLPWIVVGCLVLAFFLTFVLAPLLSLLVAGGVGALLQAGFSRLKQASGAAAAAGSGGRLGAMLSVNVRAMRKGHDLISLFCALAALALTAFGSALAFHTHDPLVGLGVIAACGFLFALLIRD